MSKTTNDNYNYDLFFVAFFFLCFFLLSFVLNSFLSRTEHWPKSKGLNSSFFNAGNLRGGKGAARPLFGHSGQTVFPVSPM